MAAAEAAANGMEPANASSYQQLFGVVEGADVVAPSLSRAPSAKPGEGAFDSFFGGSVSELPDKGTEGRPTPEGGPPQKAEDEKDICQPVGGSGGSFVDGGLPAIHGAVRNGESEATAHQAAGVRVKVWSGVATITTSVLRRVLVVFGPQASSRQTAMQVVDELTSRVSTSGLSLERITLAGPSACDYSGPGGHDLVHSVALALDADTSVLPSEAEGHDLVFCLLGSFPEELSVVDDLANVDAIRRENYSHTAKLVNLLLKDGCAHFHLLSAAQAGPEAGAEILRARGMAEDELGFVKGKQESTAAEFLRACALPVAEAMEPEDASVNLGTIARAMVNTALASHTRALMVLENADILRAGESKGDGIVPEIMSQLPNVDEMLAEWDREAAVEEARRGHEHDLVLEMFDFGKDGEEEDIAPTHSRGQEQGVVDGVVAGGTAWLETMRALLLPPQTRDCSVQTTNAVS